MIADFSGVIATFEDADIGDGKMVSASNIVISSGNELGNYSYNGDATGTGNILPVPLVVYVDDDWAVTELWTEPAGDSGADYFGYDAFATIQEAITAVKTDGTVNVLAGTYVESLIVDRTLSVIGLGDRDTIVISPAQDSNGFDITADNVVVKDLKIVTSNSGGATPVPNIAIAIKETDNVEINNVVIETTGDAAMGIWIGGSSNGLSPSSNLEIIKSQITINDVATGIYAAHSNPAHSGWIIGGSFVNANTVTAELGLPVELYDVSTSEVSYNTLITSASGGAALIWSSELSDISNLIFKHNVVDYSGGSQVAFLTDFPWPLDTTDTTVTTVTIFGNTFTNWGSRGLRIGDGVTSVTASENKFLHTGEALWNEDASLVNAVGNYWGTAVYSTINSKTNGNIDFEPYYVDSGVLILSSVPVSTVYVDDNYADGSENDGYYFGYDAFDSIQDGIDAVEEGGVVSVSAGLYNESLLIERSLTLNGIGEKPVITGDNLMDNYVIKINGTDNVTINNVEVNGQGVGTGDNAFDYGILVNNSGDITIKNSDITNIWKAGSNGIDVASSQNVVIHHNTLAHIHKRYVRYTNSNGILHTNIITGDNVDGTNRVQNLVNLWGGSSVEIYENTLHNALTEPDATPTWDSPGIFVSSYGGSGASYANIHDNEIYNGDTGIVVGSVYATEDTSTADIIGNNLHNLKWAINFEKNTVGATITENSFTDNEIAVNAEGFDPIPGPVVDAKGNWWGNITGPAEGTVFANVDYRPWYLSESDLENSILDSIAPTLIISSTETPLTNASPIPITITFSENVTDLTADEIIVTNGSKGTLTGSGADYSIDVTPGSDGVITVNIAASVAWDLAGNYNTVSNTLSVTYDSEAPTNQDAVFASNITKKGGNSMTIVSSGDTTNNVWFAPPSTSVFEEVATMTKAVNGLATSILAPATEGAYKLYVVDLAGNVSVESTATLTVDNTAPAAPVITSIATNNQINNSEEAAIIVVGTAEAKALVSVTLSDSTNSVTGTEQLTGEGTAFSITLDGTAATSVALVDGTITPLVTATDAAGNESTTTVTPTATQDTSAPSVTDKTPSNLSVGIDPASDITVTFSEEVNVDTANITISGSIDKTVNGSGTDSITIDPTTNLADNTVITIILSNITDLAGNVMDDYEWAFTTAASYSIDLKTGWNLISLPVTPTTWANTADVLASVNGNVERVWSYDAVSGGWSVYNANETSTSDLNIMTAGYGYWVKMAGDDTLTGVGTLYEQLIPSGDTPSFQLPEVSLAEGWNLIGYYQLPGEVNAPIEYALSKLDGYWSGYGSDLITFTKGTVQAITPITTMNPGEGYWIFMSGAKKYSFGDGEF